MPDHLFKYRDDSQRTEDIIKNQKIWLSLPDQLNDPFECRIGEIPKDWEQKTIRKMEKGQLLGVVADFTSFEAPKKLFSLSEQETKKWLKRLKKLPHHKQVNAMRELYSNHGIELSRPENIFKDMQKNISEVGIFSLSESCDNELMWAHYGASHQGLALGFSPVGDCKLGSKRHCLPVIYAANKPSFSAGFKNEIQIFSPGSGVQNKIRVSFEDDVFRSTISTKTPIWEYEKEWRYIEESHGLFDFPGMLTQIIFGMKMPLERRNHYMELARINIKNSVSFYEVREKKALGGVEIRRIKNGENCTSS